MILIDHIIFDKLHVLLQITDQLWELMLTEIQVHGLFNDLTWKIIMDEMQHLKVSFYFWKNEKSHIWKYISFMENNKEIVLRFFNLKLFFKPSHAQLIWKL